MDRRAAGLPLGTESQSIFDVGESWRATPRPNPEVVARAKRRRFTADYKRGIWAQVEIAKQTGDVGALLRREGLYSSHLVTWRREREAGILEAPTPETGAEAAIQSSGRGESETATEK